MERLMVETPMELKYITEFIEEDCSYVLSPETTRNYHSMLKIFAGFVEQRGYSNIDKKVLMDFIKYLMNERGNSIKRVENYLSALSSFYEYLLFDDVVDGNPVTPVRKRVIGRKYKKFSKPQQRKIISPEDMSAFINSIMDLRDRAMVLLFVKTGVRRNELINIDVQDIDWKEMSILLKKTPKRSNSSVFFDDECARVLQKWLKFREKTDPKTDALFTNTQGGRLNRNGVYNAVTLWAEKFEIHDRSSDRLEHHFSPHNLRHCFTTYLKDNGIDKDYLKELRGDARKEAVDIYDHSITKEDLRKAYLAAMPYFGVS